MHWRARIQRRLLKALGFAYEARNLKRCSLSARSDPEPDTRQAKAGDPTPYNTWWKLESVNLKTGWYMLEVEHSAQSIGCILTLETSEGERDYLLLTSKPVCKRIIRLGTRITNAVIQIDQPDCLLGRVSFTVLSERFATDRISRRLKNRGSIEIRNSMDVQSLYSVYRKQLHDGMFPQVYKHVLADIDQFQRESQSNSSSQSDRRLVLVLCSSDDNAGVDASVEAALTFGLKCGWRIEWQATTSIGSRTVTQAHESETELFFMPILTGVEYRIDVFHQMLCSVQANTRLVYADHDYLDIEGVYVNPVLKPEWNPEMLLNTDYIQLPWMVSAAWSGQIVVYQGKITKNISHVLLSASLGRVVNNEEQALSCTPSSVDNLVSVNCDGSAKPALEESEVIRIPQVLASVRLNAACVEEPTRTVNLRWSTLVEQAINNARIPAKVVASRYAHKHRVLWPLPAKQPSVDIIIPTRDKVSILRTCIESIVKKTDYGNYRLVVVDNDSQEAATEKFYQAQSNNPLFNLLRYAGAFNFSAINNFAVSHSQADVIVLLNNDTEVVSPSWLDEMVRQAMRDRIGCVGAKLYYSNGRLQHGGVIVGLTGIAGHAHRYSRGDAEGYCGRLQVSQNFSAVTAACLAVRCSIWNEAGGLDAAHLGVAWNDVDFCLKVKALGYRNLWTPHAELFHHEGLTRGADDTAEKMQRVVQSEKPCLIVGRWHKPLTPRTIHC